MQKKPYVKPEIEVVQFEAEDIITTSGDETDLDVFIDN